MHLFISYLYYFNVHISYKVALCNVQCTTDNDGQFYSVGFWSPSPRCDVTKGTDISFGLLTMHQAMCGFLANTWEGATQRQFSLS